ncbi:hypothetical protein [Rhodococcus tukisamuensis]|uniref:Uncharacterized protein n=1 Tax=Rhodococcus tukisamuensis TaxID=168276 RepID=A0A1G6P1H3_9NOCA|nr:hypothetical protein [Rhodococcus tukisamuensis]SDC73838.1 hypothetical protein SAMN05444580_101748 [Rhodococcus tukisamuensis]
MFATAGILLAPAAAHAAPGQVICPPGQSHTEGGLACDSSPLGSSTQATPITRPHAADNGSSNFDFDDLEDLIRSLSGGIRSGQQ